MTLRARHSTREGRRKHGFGEGTRGNVGTVMALPASQPAAPTQREAPPWKGKQATRTYVDPAVADQPLPKRAG
eukprot:SAG11_NODE_16203_length_554_cov_2.037363_1_plen_73_part_00